MTPQQDEEAHKPKPKPKPRLSASAAAAAARAAEEDSESEDDGNIVNLRLVEETPSLVSRACVGVTASEATALYSLGSRPPHVPGLP